MIFSKKNAKPANDAISQIEDLKDIKKRAIQSEMPDLIMKVVDNEMDQMARLDSSVPEYSIGLSYIEYLVSLPWKKSTNANIDFRKAESILSSKHHGLGQVKERILEHLSVKTLRMNSLKTVLVVDDEVMARENLSHVLLKDGYKVHKAGSGEEAVEIIKKTEIGVLITDLRMDGMDGRQLLEATRRISPSTETIIVTGYATVDSAVGTLKSGAVHYFPKPVQLNEIRECVSEIFATRKEIRNDRSPVLCFAGPPGTGKTSIGRAIAEALGRKFIRISMAGLRDEAELRGHRRTYAGAMPGKIISEIKKTGVRNPVFVLDEIDKIGRDFRGDPAAVLLEILDPEQNVHFRDNYLDAPFDLSEIMFIATANITEELPPALMDRLEIIDFHGYTENEKLTIAKEHIIPEQLRLNGISDFNISFEDEATLTIINDYTNEAGVRNLNREISSVCRKIARMIAGNISGSDKNENSRRIDRKTVENLLGPAKKQSNLGPLSRKPGTIMTAVFGTSGGSVIPVETAIMKGNSQLIITGTQPEAAREIASLSLSYIRSNAEKLELDPDFFEGRDIHIHLPSSDSIIDIHSLGLPMAAAFYSLISGKTLDMRTALTGCLSLGGGILRTTCIKDKILGAKRSGLKRIMIPEENRSDLGFLEPEVTQDMEILLVMDMEEALGAL